MKKIVFMFAAIMGIFISMTACAQKKTAKSTEADKVAEHKTLVAYFSATGTTENVAKTIAQAANAELLKIEPKQEYTAADLDWRNENSRSSQEMKNPKARPEINKAKDNLDEYDVVYLGFPIWWDLAPRIVNSFIEAYGLKGKTIIPFATSGGSDIDNAAKTLKTDYPEINWKQGKLLNGNSKQEIENWVKSH